MQRRNPQKHKENRGSVASPVWFYKLEAVRLNGMGTEITAKDSVECDGYC